MADPGKSTSGEISLAESLAFLRRRARSIVGWTATVALLAVAWTLWQGPAYVAKARIRITEPGSRASLASALASLPTAFEGLVGGSPSISTEIEVIRSRPVAGSVVDAPDPASHAPDAGLDLLVRVDDLDRAQLWRTYLRKLRGEPEPQGSLTVDIRRWDFEDSETALALRFESPEVVWISKRSLFGGERERFQLEPEQEIVYGDAALVLRPEGEVTDRSFALSLLPRQKTIDHFLQQLGVKETQRGSSVLSIGFPDGDARRSAAIVNAVVRSYLGYNRQRQVQHAGRSVAFLESELNRVRGELQLAEARLQEFGEQAGDIVLPETAMSLVQELVGLDVERAKLDLGARSKQDLLQRVRAGEFSALAMAALEASAFENFEPEVPLAALLAQRSALLAEYTEEWPEVRQLDAEITDRVGAIESLLERDIAQDHEFADDLGQIAERYTARLGEMPEVQIELLRHERSVETFSKIFTLLIGQIQEAKVREASAVPSAEVIEWAIPPRLRTRPSLRLNVAIGALVGALLGLAWGLWREMARPLTTESQTETAFGAPLLHSLPGRRGARNPLPVRDHPEGREAEGYRALRGAFLSAAGGAAQKAVVLCGAQAGEGATRTAANLALALARSGRRILLVGVDPGDASLAAWFGAQAEHGLGHVAAGVAPWAEAVVPSGEDGLDLLLADGPGVGTADLLASTRATSWLAEALAQYELVLFDAPPVLERSEAGTLASEVGAVVFVCRAERMPEHLAVEAAARVRRAGAEVLGVVLNEAGRTKAGVV